MDLVSQCECITEFYRDNPAITRKIEELFGRLRDMDILYKISQNKRLFLIYSRAICDKYVNILDTFRNAANESIMIHFANLDLYGVFNKFEHFYAFCRIINDRIEDGEKIDVSIQQLVLADQPQKLMFSNLTCPSDSLCRYVKEYLGANTIISLSDDQTEITINGILFENVYKAQDACRGLRDYIDTQNKQAVGSSESIQNLQLHNNKYIASDITAEVLDKSSIDLKLVSITGKVIDNKGNTDEKELARQWICGNPPHNNEITTDYYERYRSGNPNSVKSNVFGPIAREISNMDIIKSNGCRKWANPKESPTIHVLPTRSIPHDNASVRSEIVCADDINNFTNNPCVYLFHLRDNDYKFGVSGEIDCRHDKHIRDFTKLGCNPKLIKLWKCSSMQIMKDTEMKIKLLAKQKNILVAKYDRKEIITTEDINYVITRIDHYVSDQNNREASAVEMEKLRLDNERAQLNNENMRLQIALLKTQSIISNISINGRN